MRNMSEMWTSGAVARRLGLSGTRVRQLDQAGLLSAAAETPLGRLYRPKDVEAFAKAREAKRAEREIRVG